MSCRAAPLIRDYPLAKIAVEWYIQYMAKTDPYRIINTLQNMESIGALPSLSLKIFNKLNEPDFNIVDVAQLMLQDQAICAQILKVANSVFYARGNHITTISQAIAHLGTNVIKRLLFAIELMGIYPNNMQEARFNENDFWRHTMAGAILSQEIAYHNTSGNSETFYLTALLRNLGILIIRQFFPDLFRDVCEYAREKSVSFVNAEKKVLRLEHGEVAYLVAVRWGLPKEILYSYKQDFSTIGYYRTILEIIQTSDAILAGKKYGIWDPFQEIRFPDDYEKTYHLTEEYVTHLCDSIFTEVNELSKVLTASETSAS
jgi:HD-like signal output (HDOD) protein